MMMIIIIKNEILCLSRNVAKWLQPLSFFIIFIFLFAIALGFDQKAINKISPAIIWIAFFITTLFSIESILNQESQEGALTQLELSQYPLWVLVIAKAIAIWLISALPLILISPLLGMMLHLSMEEIGILVISLLIGSPSLTLLGLLGGALTLTIPRAGIFLGLLVLPLYIPILLLGESSLLSLINHESPLFQLSIMGSLSVLSLTLAPLATASVLAVSLD